MGIAACFALGLTAWGPGGGLARGESVRVVSVHARTGEPLPARISVRDAAGTWRWGRDASGEPFDYDGLPRVWSPGEVRVDVPPGKTAVLASRPYSFLPASAEVQVPPGGDVTVKLALRPLVDHRALGWYGGDAHTHVVHGERHHAVDLSTVVPIAKAEGLDWTAFGEVWTSVEARQPDPAELERQCRELTGELFLASWTREHPKDHLGHMAALPLRVEATFRDAAGANEYRGSLERRERFTHFEILRSLHRLGTTAIYTHPTREYGGTEESPANIARELPFDAVAAPWSLEALDVLTDAPGNAHNLRLWRFLLARGHRLAACGFSDACYDRRGERPGDTRTYVHLEEGIPRTMEHITRAIREGRTFATTGPLLVVTVDERPPGTVFPADGRQRTARVRAWNAVDYRDPRAPALLTRVVVRRNGEVWKEVPVGEETRRIDWTVEIAEDATARYVVEAHGSSRTQFAVTSPVYFEEPDEEPPRPARAVVRGTVRGDDGALLEGTVRAVEYAKDRTEVVEEADFEGGSYEIACPADCRIAVEADGYAGEMKSLLLHYDPIYRDLLWGLGREDLWDPGFYEEIETRLRDVTLDFTLARE